LISSANMYLPHSEPHLREDTFATLDQTSANLAFTSIHPDGHRNGLCELWEASARAAPPLQCGTALAGAPWGCHGSNGMQADDAHAAAHSLHAPGGLATPSEERAEAHSTVCAGRLCRRAHTLMLVAGSRIRLCLCLTLVLLPVVAYACALLGSL
jgi:hypothetical protein